MQIRIGLETEMEGRALGFALDFPGVFAYGSDDGEVLLRIPHALLEFDYWVRNHTQAPWFQLDDLDFRLTEIYPTRFEGDYEVNAFFEDDRRILSTEECAQAALVHQWQREELLAGVETLPEELLTKLFPGQRWDILGILDHIAKVERWYLSQLDIDLPPTKPGADPFACLEQSFEAVHSVLPKLPEMEKITVDQGETWSPRKFVRRLLWHQRDHIGHIQELAGIKRR